MTGRALPDFPWDLLAPAEAVARAHPGGMVDLSVGSPVDPTPAVVAEALREASDAHAYPAVAGTLALREAITAWYARRRGVELGPDAVLPTIGSKEFIAGLPTLLDLGPADAVVFPTVAYPTYALGAAMAGAVPVAADDPDEWPDNTRVVWTNSPGNPDGSVLDVPALRARVERARELGAVILADECYAELGWNAPWATAPTPCILAPEVTGGDLTGVVSVYSLSKQSNLAGYRAAFIGGDPVLLAELLRMRKHLGLMPPAPVQHAMIAALGDDAHVAEQKARYARRRAVLTEALHASGFRIDASDAGLYLWASRDEDCWATVDALASAGVLVAPGVFYGEAGAQHVRVALTVTDAGAREAANRLSTLQ